MILPTIKLIVIFLTLLLAFFQTENRNNILFWLLIIIFLLEGISLCIDYKKNAPKFVFIHQERTFDNAENPTIAKFKFEFKNLGGRTAKNTITTIKLLCEDTLLKVKEGSLPPKNIVPHQSTYPRVVFPAKACEDVFKNNKTIQAIFEIKHNEGMQIIDLEFKKDPMGISETKWKIISKEK